MPGHKCGIVVEKNGGQKKSKLSMVGQIIKIIIIIINVISLKHRAFINEKYKGGT